MASKLLKVLDDLSDKEFERFKWSLHQDDIMERFHPIPRSHSDANRMKIVDLLRQIYPENYLEVSRLVLMEMKRNDLVLKLPEGLRKIKVQTDNPVAVDSEVKLDCAALQTLSLDPGAKLLKLKQRLMKYNPVAVDSDVKLDCAALQTLSLDPGAKLKLKQRLMKYSCELRLDPKTAGRGLAFSGDNRTVTGGTDQNPPDHPERFDYWDQVLGTERLNDRCYWEVEWKGAVHIAVSYWGISRKGRGRDCGLGGNEKSWSLDCSDDDGYSVWHNDIDTVIPLSSCSVSHRVAVYLDWSAGSVSFYKADPLTLIHTIQSRFTEDLYPGFYVWPGASVSLC